MKIPTSTCTILALVCLSGRPAFASSCDSLAALALKDTIITAAQLVPAGQFPLDRQAILAIIRSPSYRLDHASRTNVFVRALGHEAAVVRHRSQAAGSFEGDFLHG